MDRRVTAPGDCLKRLVLAGLQTVALSGWRARAFNSCRESLERHCGILLLRVLVANREIVAGDSDHPGRLGGDARIASVCGHGIIRADQDAGLLGYSRWHWSVPYRFTQAVSYGQNSFIQSPCVLSVTTHSVIRRAKDTWKCGLRLWTVHFGKLSEGAVHAKAEGEGGGLGGKGGQWRSLGLAAAGRLRRWRGIMVGFAEEWPRRDWVVRMSVPLWRRRVGKQCVKM